MTIDERTIRNLCTAAVLERGQQYRTEGHIQRLERFDDVVTAQVAGSNLYDVVVTLAEHGIDARCTCPYRGAGACKHVIAILLEISAEPPDDESERVDPVLEAVAAADLRAFVRDALATDPDLRERFLARFGDGAKPVKEYRNALEPVLDRHTQDSPVITAAIDFSHFLELAALYRDRDKYRSEATVYRALFEVIDDNWDRIDAAFDHYGETVQSALDGYVDCLLEADLSAEELEQYAAIVAERAASKPDVTSNPFQHALEDLEERR